MPIDSTGTRSLKLIFVLLERDADQLSAGAHAGLLKQALQDGLHVAFGDLQPPRDFLIRQAFQHEAQHLALPFVETGGAASPASPSSLATLRPGSTQCRRPATARMLSLSSASGRLFQENAGDALPHQTARFVVADPGGHDEDAAFKAGLPRRRQELRGALGAQVMVEQHQVERVLREERERVADAGAVLDMRRPARRRARARRFRGKGRGRRPAGCGSRLAFGSVMLRRSSPRARAPRRNSSRRAAAHGGDPPPCERRIAREIYRPSPNECAPG